MCTICQCEMEENDIAHLENCDHLYCFGCIKEWGTKAENSCPLCKKKFNSIKYFNQQTNLHEEFKIEDKKQRINEEDLWVIDENSDELCYVCGTDADP